MDLVQDRLKQRASRIAFLVLAGLLAAWAPVAEESPKPALKTLATDDVDFRACDRDWNQVNPLWTAEPEPVQPD